MSADTLPDLGVVIVATSLVLAMSLSALVVRRSLAAIAAGLLLAWQTVALLVVALGAHTAPGESGDPGALALVLLVGGQAFALMLLVLAWNLRRRSGFSEVDSLEPPSGQERA